jgi:predicted SAM-dependent methyltransferase
MKLALDIGSGGNLVEMPNTNFIKLDIRPETNPDLISNATLLPFGNGSFDVVHSSHVLEHFPRRQWKWVLNEWARVVRIGGEIWLKLPNILWACERIVRDGIIDQYCLDVLYGGQENEYDFHYNGLTPNTVRLALEERGFKLIHFSEQSYNMILGAIKI